MTTPFLAFLLPVTLCSLRIGHLSGFFACAALS